MILRFATPLDEELLCYWDRQPHVIEARNSNPNEDDWNWAEELRRSPEWRELLIAEIDTRPIGFMQIIDPAREETHYWGDCEPNLRAIDIWIGEKLDVGKGYGTVMMRLAIERCFAKPDVKAIIIDPLETNTNAIRFYERLGFRLVEKRLFDEDACLVYRLDRENFSVPSES